MMRRLLLPAVSLLLGLLTTVAVAWACGAGLDFGSQDLRLHCMTADAVPCWRIAHVERPGVRNVIAWPHFAEDREPLRRSETLWEGDPNDIPRPWPEETAAPPLRQVSGRGAWRAVIASGWPWPAFSCECRSDPSDTLAARGFHRDGSGFIWEKQPVGLGVFGHRVAALPYRPIWTGLIADVAALGSAWFVVLLVRRAVRRRIRYLAPRGVVITGAVCVAFAAISTLLVAWASAAWVDLAGSRGSPTVTWGQTWGNENRPVPGPLETPTGYLVWDVWVDRLPGAARVRSYVSRGPQPRASGIAKSGAADVLPAWARFVAPDDDAERRADAVGGEGAAKNGGVEITVVDARGWPALALRSRIDVETVVRDEREVEVVGDVGGGIVLEPREARPGWLIDQLRVLPLVPMWPGFLVDTVAHAGVLAVLFVALAGPGILRRSFRFWRRRCVTCGYDLSHAEHAQCPECGTAVALPER